MTVTVAIPTYNSARTIGATLDAVLAQSLPPEEILVVDDGSSDATLDILSSYGDRVRVTRQEHKGVASARNTLSEQSSGDLVAFLDHDDLWHSTYLEVQSRNYAEHPDAVAFFTEHVNFSGYGDFDWSEVPPGEPATELVSPKDFLRRYSTAAGPFGSASFLCVPREVLRRLRPEPFKISGADDAYLCIVFPLLGPVCYSTARLVAYRVTDEALSSDRLQSYGQLVEVFELLRADYEKQGSQELSDVFRAALASKRRQYAKRLMGVGEKSRARRQLWVSAQEVREPRSLAKSLGLLSASYLPGALQPAWPGQHRTWQEVRRGDAAERDQ